MPTYNIVLSIAVVDNTTIGPHGAADWTTVYAAKRVNSPLSKSRTRCEVSRTPDSAATSVFEARATN